MSICALLGSCVVGPDYRTPAPDTPSRWSEEALTAAPAAPAADLGRWWSRFGDPALDGLIQRAVEQNLDVAAAKARVREARATVREAGGTLLPALDPTASFARDRSTAAGTQPAIADQVQAGFDASWEIDLFGANRRSIEAAGYGLDAGDEDLRSALLTLVGDVAANYVTARGYQARIALARRSAVTVARTVALTRLKIDTGGASGVDLANAMALESSSQAQIQSLLSTYALSAHRIGVLVGQAPAALDEMLARPAPMPLVPPAVPVGVPADVLRRRPDVHEAERKLAQATALIGAAQAARYPAISLTGSVATSGTSVGTLRANSSIGWAFGASASVPIFNGGRLAAAVDAAAARRDQYLIAFRTTVLKALEDVENASVSLSRERLRNGYLAASATAYGEATHLAQVRYESGSTGLLEVLDAERSLISAQDSLVASSVAIATDYIALNKALGGGWDGAVDPSEPTIVDTNTGPHRAGTRSQ